MAGRHHDTKRRISRKASSETSSSSSYSSASSDSETPEPRRRSSSGHRVKSGRHHCSRKEREEEGSRKRSRKRKERRRARDKEEEESRRRRRKKPQRSDSDGSYGGRASEDDESSDPKAAAGLILERFPDVADDLKQLLQMIDNGQGVDLGGILKKSLAKLLKKLFWSLKLKENDDGIFFLPPKGIPTLEIIGSTICSHSKSQDNQLLASRSPNGRQLSPSDIQHMKSEDDANAVLVEEKDLHDKPSSPPRRRLIGPEMPSRELLAAAAELTEAETLLREADLEVDNNLFIGPPPPAVVAEAESANEAERFEEVARIATAEVDKPYDVLGVNWKMSSENIKKRYWKLSLMIHPDKCSHPQAHQAFVILNKAFKELQDPEKRKEIDEKIKLKEEQEAFMAELKSLREAAQWRRLQGISLEGDEELLAVPKEAPKRDEWMTTLPPERKPGMTMQSTSFSRTTKEGRGDTSVWTDSPLDKAQKAKQNYLEAYNKAKSLADADEKKKGVVADADLVDKYNASKRGKSLMQKHQEESKKPKKKAKQQEKVEKEEWEGQHPWKPWDREKDLATGRTEVKFDSENMGQGLASRFSSGAMQRNFL